MGAGTSVYRDGEGKKLHLVVEIGAPPPVPPCRRKRKTDIALTKPSTAPRNNQKKHILVVKVADLKPDRKPRLLPPPLPVPRSASRERKRQSLKNTNLPSIVLDNSKSSSVKLKSSDMSLNSKPLTKEFTDMTKSQCFVITETITNEEPPKISNADEPNNLSDNQNLEYRNVNRSGRSSAMSSTHAPMFFTFKDYENVMTHAGISDRSINEQYESIITPEAVGSIPISSLTETSLISEKEEIEQSCFRITTTNVPFKKCIGSLRFSIGNTDLDEKLHEPDHHIFEDYTDRSKISNARTVSCLFNDDTFNHFDKDDGVGSMRRSSPKVRFVIESPSSSTTDPDLDNTGDSLGNTETTIVGDVNENHKTSGTITEIMKRNQLILHSGIKTIYNLDSGKNCDVESVTSPGQVSRIFNNKEKAANYVEPKAAKWPESMERKNHKNHHLLRSSHSLRFMSPKKPTSDAIPNINNDLMPELPITYDPRDEGFVRKYWGVNSDDFNSETHANNQSSQVESSCRTSREGSRAARQAFVKGKLNADSNENQNLNYAINDDSTRKDPMPSDPRVAEKNTFIYSELRDLIADNDDIEGHDLSEDEEDGGKLHSATNDIDRKCEESDAVGLPIRETYLIRKVSIDKYPMSLTVNDNANNYTKSLNKEKFKFGPELTGFSRPQYLINTLTFSTQRDDVDCVPVSVYRNSFLTNMLTDDKTGSMLERNDPCSIIVAHPKPMFPQAAVRSPVRNIPQEVVVEGISVFRNVDKSSNADTIGTVRSGSNRISQNLLGKETGVNIIDSKSIRREEIASGWEIDKKRSAKAKSDLLSELLCNFGGIKLKSVESYKREIDWAEVDDKPTFEKKIGDNMEKKEDESVGGNETGVIQGPEMSCNETKVKGAVVKAVDSRLTQVSMMKTSATTTKRLDFENSSLKNSANCGSGKMDHHTSLHRIDDQSAIVVLECMKERVGWSRNDKDANSIISDPSIIRMTVDQHVVDVDKCFIARKSNLLTRCNNNDNNAMTPVAVSNDGKSQNTDVTIAPGSVKTFVKLYEFEHDPTSKNSKNNYSVPVAKQSKTRCCKTLMNNAKVDAKEKVLLEDENVEILMGAEGEQNGAVETKAQAGTQIVVQRSFVHRLDQGKNDNATYSVITKNIVIQNGKTSPARVGLSSTNDSTYMQHRQHQFSRSDTNAAKTRSQESCFNTTTKLSPRSESKKSVTFYSNCKVIKSNYDEGVKQKTKRRAPERPATIRKIEEHDCATKFMTDCNWETKTKPTRFITAENTRNPTLTPRSDAGLICTQIQPVVEGNKSDITGTGITLSVPKSDGSHPRQPYVFHCRV